jgi:hypothetical protein
MDGSTSARKARIRLAAAWLMGVALAGSTALAQGAPMDRDRQPRSETEGQSPPPSGSQDLSRELDRSHGVIRPPQGIDPEMQVRPADPGGQRTPVIPPPGTPGGDPSIQPK